MHRLVTALAALAVLTALVGEATANPDLHFGEEIFPTLPIAAVWSDNPRCRADSLTLVRNLRNSTVWAMQMWDASAKSAVGALAGNVFQMGNFDECVAQVRPVRAQYCLATVTVSLRADTQLRTNGTKGTVWEKIKYDGNPEKIRRDVVHWALCVPASCSHSDVEASVNRHLASTARNNSLASVRVEVGAALCQTGRQEETLSTGTVAFCVVLALIIAVVAASTVFDYSYCRKEDNDHRNRVASYLLCFSLRKNVPEVTIPAKSELNLDCLNGLRVLTMCAIIAEHRIALTVTAPIQNFARFEKMYGQLDSIVFFRGDILVDNFFVISSILVTYVLCMTLDMKKVNPLNAFILRYVRLTPVYMLVVFFYATLMYHMGDGPVWDLIVSRDRDRCVKNWWTNLLYINNYVNDNDLCMIQSWYMPCDTHYFVIALLVVSVLHKRPKTGMYLLGALIFGSALVSFIITYIGHEAPLLYFYRDIFAFPRDVAYFRSMYTKSHTRAGPYFVGMATGYFLYRTRAHKKNYKWESTAVMALSFLVCCASVFPAFYFYDRHWEYDVLQASIYAGVNRIAWALGVCGLIVAVVFSESSVIGAVLAWWPFTSLSKLVYSQLLVHTAIQIIDSSSIRSPTHFSWFHIGSLVVTDIIMSLVISLTLYLSVEAPIKLVAKKIMTPRRDIPEHVADNPTEAQKTNSLYKKTS